MESESRQLPLSGRVALITGASRGIGRAIANTLAAQGASVAITFREQAAQAVDTVREIEGGGGLCCRIPTGRS